MTTERRHPVPPDPPGRSAALSAGMRSGSRHLDEILRRWYRAKSGRARVLELGLALALIGLLPGTYLYYFRYSGSPADFRTARVVRGPLTATVATTGTLNAVITVQVGTQISGQVRELFADFNSRVSKGQLIARIDPSGYEAKVGQARADVEAAEANVLNQHAQVERARADIVTAEANTANQRAQIDRAQADVENARAARAGARAQTAKAGVAVADSKRDLDRKTGLLAKELISRSELDSAQAVHDSALAQLEANRAQEDSFSSAIQSALGQLASSRAQERAMAAGIQAAAAQFDVITAQLKAAEASVRQKRAALQQAMVDLEHTSIRSPVDGVVVSRAVDIGQTVAASLQAPTLFTIAQDLTKMQLDTNVDEADIGRVQEGQRATFTVDSFRGQTFAGQVVQVRKAARVVQNVVTYNVVIAFANPGQRLLPGLTANIRILTDERQNVLKLPNAALRLRPGAGETTAPPEPGTRVTGIRAAGVAASEEIRGQLVRELALSESQQQTLEPILNERRERLMAVERLPGAQRRGAALNVREETRTKIRALLNPDQRIRFDQLPIGQPVASGPEGRAGTVWVFEEGKLRAVPVHLGITDGQFTELLDGEIREGQEVVVAINDPGAAPRPPTPAAGAPRFKL